MDALLFDVDDTLYDQLGPFESAYKDLFADQYGIAVEQLFFLSRKYSDEAFERSQSGEISMDEMYIYRLQKAFLELGIEITSVQALEFQHQYAGYQKTIGMSDLMKEILSFCKGKVRMGIITNGEAGHQQRKIKQLQIQRWIPRENIFVSGELGTAKPDKQIFQKACERLGVGQDNVWYVGDSYPNDVEGARNAGLHSIWIRRRDNRQEQGSIRPDYCVWTEEELFLLLRKLLNAKK